MTLNRIITLTTDFGYKDPFVAEMKGVILSINPHAIIVDITHSIQPQDIEEAAYIIGSSFGYFPSGTIHIVVVDPGVGSRRKALILDNGGFYFVGPDNGVFSHILGLSQPVKGVYITEERYMRSNASPTFQGRDLFAPAGAWLSKGLPPGEFGPPAKDFGTFPVPRSEVTHGGISGQVIYVDSFGNAITNITGADLTSFAGHYVVEINNAIIQPVKYYAQAGEKSLSCLVNSSGYLELFVNKGNAAEQYGIKKGDRVIVHVT
ncbi:MAG: S-adenosyl-l-methionine hydroxide adenosyltransferase family protein [Dissulfurispiraceae bacterium]